MPFWNERFSSFQTCSCVCVLVQKVGRWLVRLSHWSSTWLEGAVLFLFFSDVHRLFKARVSNLNQTEKLPTPRKQNTTSPHLQYTDYSFAEVNMLVEKSFQSRRNDRIKHIVVGEIFSPCNRSRCQKDRQLTLLSQLL